MTLQKLLGIELPIIQAPMAGVQNSAMAKAVSEAGGLGSLPCAMLSPPEMASEIALIRSGTQRPYNLNFFCHTPPVPSPDAATRWLRTLAPYYQEMGLDVGASVPGPQRAPFTEDIADQLSSIQPPVVSFHFGLPSEQLMERVQAWGSKVLGCATTVAEALWLEQRGADVVIAQGTEAGGHRGHFLSMDLDIQAKTARLLDNIVSRVSVPVVAAGGIACAEDVRELMSRGAAGVQVGTAYLLCDEATTRQVHRDALTSPAARETQITNVFSGRPARGIVNRLIREQGPISPLAPEFPLASDAVAPLRTAAEENGSGDFSPLWAGENVSGCKPVSAARLTRELAGLL